MESFQRIPITQAREIIRGGQAHLVDIRDEQSFKQSHVSGAAHLDNSSIQDFLQDADPDLPVLVYCYHGNSSQSAAAFLVEKGFEEVYSVDGGFEQWRVEYPADTASS